MFETDSSTGTLPISPPFSLVTVRLSEGQVVSLNGLALDELRELQWEQEQKFAQLILAQPKGSQERLLVVRQAYDTICTILDVQSGDSHEPLVMGLDARYVALVLRLLEDQARRGIERPRLFEIGYGCGALLKQVRKRGFDIGGIEVSETMCEQAVRSLSAKDSQALLLGDFREVQEASLRGRPTLVYWNDVFEHIAPDEISDYLSHIHHLLTPRGMLVTITPNWLLRPLDATGIFFPARTEARGLHLKEYRLAEVTRLLKKAGFRRIATPLFVTRKRLVLCGGGGRLFKQAIEPLLDKIPVKLGHLFCRGFAMSCTIATK